MHLFGILQLSVVVLTVSGIPLSNWRQSNDFSTALIGDLPLKRTDFAFHRSDYEKLARRYQSLKNSSSGNVDPGHSYDYLFIFTFSLGDDLENPYFLSFETGVTKAFVVDKTATEPRRHPSGRTYDPQNSTTAVPKPEPFSVITGGHLAEGKTYIEDLRVMGLEPPIRQKIGSVTKMNYSAVLDLDGVFGLGWDPDVKKQVPGEDAAPVVNLIAIEPNIPQKYTLEIYSSFGSIIWGRSIKGLELPVHSAGGQPAIYVDSIKFGNYESHVKTSAIIDNGYSSIALPSALYRLVLKTVDAKFDPEIGLLTVDCGDNSKRPPKFVFTIGGKEFEVRQIHYVFDRDLPGEKCILAVSQSVDGHIHLGMPFIHTVFITFDIGANKIVLKHQDPNWLQL